MKIILSQKEVNEILREFVANKFNVEVIDISSYDPYTFEVTTLETKTPANKSAGK